MPGMPGMPGMAGAAAGAMSYKPRRPEVWRRVARAVDFGFGGWL